MTNYRLCPRHIIHVKGVVKAERQTVPQLSMVGPRGLSQVYETQLHRLKIKNSE